MQAPKALQKLLALRTLQGPSEVYKGRSGVGSLTLHHPPVHDGRLQVSGRIRSQVSYTADAPATLDTDTLDTLDTSDSEDTLETLQCRQRVLTLAKI